MTVTVIVGAQWGDEGKGKVVDVFTERADVVVRYAGGPNAGHTLVVGERKVIVRLLPSGVLRPNIECVLGPGVVVDLEVLCGEIDALNAGDISVESRLSISDRAHVIMPYHLIVDGAREQRSGGEIGTTKKGIGPAYEDKARRTGIRMGDLRDGATLKLKLEQALAAWQPVLRDLGAESPSVAEMLQQIEPFRARLVGRVGDVAHTLDRFLAQGQRVLMEGAQGTLLDVDHGTYPYVTSSSAVAGGAATGGAIGPSRIDRVFGIAKAYSTRVGGGPFPTELDDAAGQHLRDVGAEYGSVTGRPRRTGWLDLPALRYACRVNGMDALALTKLDVLSGLDPIRVCVAYDTPQGRTEEFPWSLDEQIRPVYQELPGWSEPLDDVRTLEQLPAAARSFIELVEDAVKTPIALVSVGARRDQVLRVGDFLD